jgi:hypothetical protein
VTNGSNTNCVFEYATALDDEEQRLWKRNKRPPKNQHVRNTNQICMDVVNTLEEHWKGRVLMQVIDDDDDLVVLLLLIGTMIQKYWYDDCWRDGCSFLGTRGGGQPTWPG